MPSQKGKVVTKSKEMASLTMDHHDGLLLGWKINAGLKKGVPCNKIADYILYFYNHYLEAHLVSEEHNVFTLLAKDNADRREAELQHARIQVRMEYFRAGYPLSEQLLKDFAEVLNDNIRFEERVLFKAIEKEADPGKAAPRRKENKERSNHR